MLFRNVCSKRNVCWSCSRLSVCFVWSYNTYISLGIVKDSSDCFRQSNLFLLYRQNRKKNNKVRITYKNIDQSAQAKSLDQTCFFLGFIKYTDHRPNEHRPLAHWPTEPTTSWINNHTWKTWQQKHVHFVKHKDSWENI